MQKNLIKISYIITFILLLSVIHARKVLRKFHEKFIEIIT